VGVPGSTCSSRKRITARDCRNSPSATAADGAVRTAPYRTCSVRTLLSLVHRLPYTVRTQSLVHRLPYTDRTLCRTLPYTAVLHRQPCSTCRTLLYSTDSCVNPYSLVNTGQSVQFRTNRGLSLMATALRGSTGTGSLPSVHCCLWYILAKPDRSASNRGLFGPDPTVTDKCAPVVHRGPLCHSRLN